jgi:hypothetical protein
MTAARLAIKVFNVRVGTVSFSKLQHEFTNFPTYATATTTRDSNSTSELRDEVDNTLNSDPEHSSLRFIRPLATGQL